MHSVINVHSISHKLRRNERKIRYYNVRILIPALLILVFVRPRGWAALPIKIIAGLGMPLVWTYQFVDLHRTVRKHIRSPWLRKIEKWVARALIPLPALAWLFLLSVYLEARLVGPARGMMEELLVVAAILVACGVIAVVVRILESRSPKENGANESGTRSAGDPRILP